jgi:hypothetical protein
MKRIVLALAAAAIAASLATAQDLVPRRLFVDRPVGKDLSATVAELCYQIALASSAELGGVEVVRSKDAADCWLETEVRSSGESGTIIAVMYDRLASFGKDEVEWTRRDFPVKGFGALTLREDFGVPLGRWIAADYPMVETNVREIVTVRVVEEVKNVDLSKGADLLVKTMPGATVRLFDGSEAVADANGLARFGGIPQNSTVTFTVTMDGYYTETRTIVFGKLEEKTLVELTPVLRYHAVLISSGPYGFDPAFQWDAIPDALLVGLHIHNNALFAGVYARSEERPSLYFIEPEAYVAYRFGSGQDPFWFEFGVGAWMRFDISTAPELYGGGLSAYVPAGFRIRVSAYGRFDDRWSLAFTWAPSVFYSDTLVNETMEAYTGRTEYSPNDQFAYSSMYKYDCFDPHERWFYSLFEFFGGVVFSF